jgi:hypothetical protein
MLEVLSPGPESDTKPEGATESDSCYKIVTSDYATESYTEKTDKRTLNK